MYSLYGVENPLMDIIAHVDYGFLSRFGKQPGTMHLVEYAEVRALLKEIGSFHTTPGGSAANTARGIAWLGGPAGRARGLRFDHGAQVGENRGEFGIVISSDR